METSRRSLTISDLPLDNTAALCPEEDITGKSVCILLLCVHEIFYFQLQLYCSQKRIAGPLHFKLATSLELHIIIIM